MSGNVHLILLTVRSDLLAVNCTSNDDNFIVYKKSLVCQLYAMLRNWHNPINQSCNGLQILDSADRSAVMRYSSD